MGISSFKFMNRDSAPGVQVIETDNSQMPAAADAIGAERARKMNPRGQGGGFTGLGR